MSAESSLATLNAPRQMLATWILGLPTPVLVEAMMQPRLMRRYVTVMTILINQHLQLEHVIMTTQEKNIRLMFLDAVAVLTLFVMVGASMYTRC